MLLGALGLGACAVALPPIDWVGIYRDPAVPIYSAAVFDRDRFLDAPWDEVAAFVPTDGAGCTPGRIGFSTPDAGFFAAYSLCLSGREREGAGRIVFSEQGRFALAGLDEPLWVLWADADMRTVVIGTPSGRLGFVLSRGVLSPDRWTAAQDILEWNGYDLDRLVMLR